MVGQEVARRERPCVPRLGLDERPLGERTVPGQLGLHPADEKWLRRQRRLAAGAVDRLESARGNRLALASRSRDLGHSKRQLHVRVSAPQSCSALGRDVAQRVDGRAPDHLDGDQERKRAGEKRPDRHLG